MSSQAGVFHRLHTGTGAFDIVGKRRRWYMIIGLLFAICVGSMAFKGFHLGIDFVGGTKIEMPAQSVSGPIQTQQVEDAFTQALGRPAETVQTVGAGASQSIQIRSETLNSGEIARVKEGLFTSLQPVGTDGRPSPQAISDTGVSGTWGGEITKQAMIALVVFLVLVTVFLAIYFERWMAVAALAALIHDIVITAGVYSLVGFEVTPSTVIGLLTILGFSLYDTVVVFDKVKENSRGLLSSSKRTYPEAANLAVNQTLMRSINTSVIALLPVLGLLVVGAGLLGVGVLRDLALVQATGMIAGVISSIYLATPLLVDFKMRNPKFRAHETKVHARRQKASAADSSAELAIETGSNAETAAVGVGAGSAGSDRASSTNGSSVGRGRPNSNRQARPTGKANRGRRRR